MAHFTLFENLTLTSQFPIPNSQRRTLYIENLHEFVEKIAASILRLVDSIPADHGDFLEESPPL